LQRINAFTMGAVEGNMFGIAAVEEEIDLVTAAIVTFYRQPTKGALHTQPGAAYCALCGTCAEGVTLARAWRQFRSCRAAPTTFASSRFRTISEHHVSKCAAASLGVELALSLSERMLTEATYLPKFG